MLKRDGGAEAFDRAKLRGCLLRVLPAGRADVYFADALAEGIACYLRRGGVRCVSSAAILEMVLTVLRAVGMGAPTAALERRHAARLALRATLVIRHDRGRRTAWSKDWLVRQACSRWGLGRTAARIVAGQIEQSLLRRPPRDLSRSAVMKMLTARVADYGLAARQAPAPAVRQA